MRRVRTVAALLAVLLLASPALAHVPTFPTDNTTPDRAVEVAEPVKSWSFYDSLGEGQVKYYRATVQPGDRLRVGTFTPRGGAFTPSLVVMSDAFEARDAVPPGVTVPDGMGAVVVAGERPRAPSYEPFAPSANYQTASFDQRVEAERTYVIAVYEPANRTGPAGVAIGYEEAFTPTEYLTVPFDLVRTHLWEGQRPLVVVGPFLLTLLAGLGLLARRSRREGGRRPTRLALAGAGLLVLGSGVNTAVLMAVALTRTGPTPAALVTAVFVVVPLVGGGWAVGLGLRPDRGLTPRRRVGLATAGVLSLLTWAGFIVGPALLVGLAVTPPRVLGE